MDLYGWGEYWPDQAYYPGTRYIVILESCEETSGLAWSSGRSFYITTLAIRTRMPTFGRRPVRRVQLQVRPLPAELRARARYLALLEIPSSPAVGVSAIERGASRRCTLATGISPPTFRP